MKVRKSKLSGPPLTSNKMTRVVVQFRTQHTDKWRINFKKDVHRKTTSPLKFLL